jgi:hypothetical protein
MPALIGDAKTLLGHLSENGGTNNIYFRILSVTISKCERTLKDDLGLPGNGDGRSRGLAELDAETDFQSYVPKEFILDWNFPGLTFCWIPFDFQDMFIDFASGF